MDSPPAKAWAGRNKGLVAQTKNQVNEELNTDTPLVGESRLPAGGLQRTWVPARVVPSLGRPWVWLLSLGARGVVYLLTASGSVCLMALVGGPCSYSYFLLPLVSLSYELSWATPMVGVVSCLG